MSSDLDFLLENAPSEAYREKLSALLNQKDMQITAKESVINQQMDIVKNTNRITKDIKEKLKVISTFMETITHFCPTSEPTIFGSFVRTLFERVFTPIYDPDSKGYANSINHDVDLYVYPTSFNYNPSDFKTFIQTLKLHIKLKNDVFVDNFKILSIVDKTITNSSKVSEQARKILKDLPHYVIIFGNGTDYIKCDVLAYKIDRDNIWTNEFDVNSLEFSCNGIKSAKNFINVISNIVNKTATCNVNFNIIMRDLMSRSLNRSQKIPLLNEILFFSTMRTKILSIGYESITSNIGFLSLTVEKESPCEITSQPAPFIKMELVCGHQLSLMAIAGIINVRSSEFTEAIPCPYCRKSLIPKLVKNAPVKITNPIIIDTEPPVAISLQKYDISDEIISEENIAYVQGLIYGLTPEQVLSGRFDYTLVE